MARIKRELNFKCPYCTQMFSTPQSLQVHIAAKHPQMVSKIETDPLANPPKNPKTQNRIETEDKNTKPSPEVKEKDYTTDEIEEIIAERETYRKEKEDLEKKLEIKEHEETTRRESIMDEQERKEFGEVVGNQIKSGIKPLTDLFKTMTDKDKQAQVAEAKKTEKEEREAMVDEKVKAGITPILTKVGDVSTKLTELVDCKLNPNHPDCVLPKVVKVEPKEEKKEEPETEVSEKDKQILEDFPKVRDHVNALTGEQKDSPFGVLAAAAKHAQQTILDSGKTNAQELARYTPDALKEVIRESGAPETVKKHLESMEAEDIAKYIREQCTGEHCKPITLALRGMGINVQKETEGGGMLGGGFQDID